MGLQGYIQLSLVFLFISWDVLQSADPKCNKNALKPKEVLTNSLQKSPEINVIFLIDASKSIGNTSFIEARNLMEEILQKYYIVHPNFAQVAIIVYSTNVITAINHVYRSLVSCKLFYRNEIKNTVKWEDGDKTELPRALDTALEIFQNSNRTGASKVLWLFADGQKETTSTEHFDKAREMKTKLNVEIFSVGIGKWYDADGENAMQELASDVDHYACIEQWTDIVDTVYLENDITGYGDRVWYSVNDEADVYCQAGCSSGSQCFCNASSLTAECICPPQFFQDMHTGACQACPAGYCKVLPGPANCTADQCPPDPPHTGDPLEDVLIRVFGINITVKWFIVIIVVLVSVIIIIIILCVFCCYCCRRRKKQSSTSTSKTDTLQMKNKRPPPPPPKDLPKHKDLPPDYDDVIYGTVDVDMSTISRQKLHQGMEGWAEYMAAGVEARQLSGMQISTLDDSVWARTPQFRVPQREVLEVHATLEMVVNNHEAAYETTQVTLQGKTYAVHENNGLVLEGRGPIGGRSENVICAVSNGNYVIIGKAPAEHDRGGCKLEVLRVLGHFQQYDQNYSTLNIP